MLTRFKQSFQGVLLGLNIDFVNLSQCTYRSNGSQSNYLEVIEMRLAFTVTASRSHSGYGSLIHASTLYTMVFRHIAICQVPSLATVGPGGRSDGSLLATPSSTKAETDTI